MLMYELFTGNHLDILAQFDDCTFDLTITSPPYDNQREYQGYNFQFEPLAKELCRVSKVGAVVVWIVNDATHKGCESLTSFKQAIYFVEECGFNLHDTMIYAKKNYVPLTHNRYEQQFEYVFVLSKGRVKTFNPIMIPTLRDDRHYNLHNRTDAASKEKRNAMRRGVHRRANETFKTKESKIKPNIWFYGTGLGGSTSDKEAYQHPAILPEQLAHDHIVSWSNPGNLILDPMCGSGTVGKMAVLAERDFVGIDICQEYVDIARERIEKALKKPKQLELF